MKKRCWSILILSICFLIPLVSADLITPYLYKIYGLSLTAYLIPIVLVESLVAYLFLKKIEGVRFWHLLLVFLAANIVSAVIGIIFSFTSPGYQLIGSYRGVVGLGEGFVLGFFLLYIFSSIIEFPFLHFYLRKKSEKPFTRALVLSFLVKAK